MAAFGRTGCQLSRGKSGGAEAQTNGRRRRNWLPYLTIGLLLALIGVGITFSGTLYRIVTDKGQLLIEVDDKDVEVKIVQNGVVVQDKTNQREFTLRAGKGEIEVLEKDGVKLATKQFELTAMARRK